MLIYNLSYTLGMEGQREYLAAFAAFPKINTRSWQSIIGYFPSLADAWCAKLSELREAGLEEETAIALISYKSKTDPVRTLEKLEKFGINLISILDETYPENLKEIHNPPFVLYVRGQLLPDDENAIAVVGSRRATDYGRRATAEITEGEVKHLGGMVYTLR